MVGLKERFQLVVQRMQIKFIQRLLLKSRVVPEQSQPKPIDAVVVLQSVVSYIHFHQHTSPLEHHERAWTDLLGTIV